MDKIKLFERILNEAYDEKTHKYKPFKRYKSQGVNNSSYFDWDDEDFNASNTKLEDMATFILESDIKVNDLIKLDSEYDEERDDPDGNYYYGRADGGHWMEIVETNDFLEGEPERKKNGEFRKLYSYIYVDDYGKPLTKAQVKKFDPAGAAKMETNGYAGYFEVRHYDASERFARVLCVRTIELEKYMRTTRDGDAVYKSYGHQINRDNMRRKQSEFIYDDNDKRVLNDEGKEYVEKNPDDYYIPDHYYQKEEWPVYGNKEVRRHAADRVRYHADQKKGREERAAAKQKAWEEKYGELANAAGNPWMSGMPKEFETLNPGVDKDTLKKIYSEAKSRGYGYGSKISDEEWEKLLDDNNIDRESIKAVSHATSSTFAQAKYNHDYGYR